MKTIAVIGAGASGLMAALVAAEHGAKVLLFEKNTAAGKKLNATGNGRGNIANRNMGPEFYYSSDPVRLRALIANTDRDAVLNEFSRMGILFRERNGYIYPRTDLAATLTDALLLNLNDRSVELHLGEAVTGLLRDKEQFLIRTDKQLYGADKVICAGGGLAGPQFGASKDMLRLAESLGHTVADLHPALTFLCSDDACLKYAAGVRAHARATLFTGDADFSPSEVGEVQFNKNNLSGIPVFQISRFASEAAGKKAPVLVVDLLPEVGESEWDLLFQSRMNEKRNRNILEWLRGLVHPKLAAMAAAKCSVAAETKIRKLSYEKKAEILQSLRELSFTVTGTGDFRDAQVTAGGIRLAEISDTYESLCCSGLYFTGEILDVDGMCGGYNLTFAMSSGRTAAIAAAGTGNT